MVPGTEKQAGIHAHSPHLYPFLIKLKVLCFSVWICMHMCSVFIY